MEEPKEQKKQKQRQWISDRIYSGYTIVIVTSIKAYKWAREGAPTTIEDNNEDQDDLVHAYGYPFMYLYMNLFISFHFICDDVWF